MIKESVSVSIITICQLKRFNCLEILKDLIKEQTYENIIEWVIVEGSKNKIDASHNSENIKKLKENSDLKFPILYIEYLEDRKLEEFNFTNLKNISTNCNGDIIIHMNEEDYYPVQRVEHVVSKLSSSKCLVAECSNILIYDYFLEKLYKVNSNNHCVAFKKEYLNSSVDTIITEKLDAEYTSVISSHDLNTFDKRELLTGGTNKINKTLNQIDESITNYIKEPYFSRFRNIFYKESDSVYDITYVSGGFSVKWVPSDMTLGGSEQAIVNLATSWKKQGKKVIVYGEIEEMIYNGVEYVSWKKFPFEQKHKLVILWRNYGLACICPFPIKAKKIWLDLHDNSLPNFKANFKIYGHKIDKILFKSNFHKNEFELNNGILDSNKYAIIPNGIRLTEFSENKDNVKKNLYRFVYCSCYTRGLAELLQYTWPVIYKIEPKAELHVYYGMDNIKNQEIKMMYRHLLSQPGVMDHGRQPLDIIIREKYMSSFHLYITNTPSEIDCITIRESLATGTIPLISNFGVFKDREGVHFDLKENNIKCYENIGLKICELMKQGDNLNIYREKIKKSNLLINWTDTAKEWWSIYQKDF